jgi:TusA-related sulfurtransferase
MKLSKIKEGTYELDLRSYEGSHLYLYISNALDKLKSGEVLNLVYDDTYSRENLSLAYNSPEYEVLETTRKGATYTMSIRKK